MYVCMYFHTFVLYMLVWGFLLYTLFRYYLYTLYTLSNTHYTYLYTLYTLKMKDRKHRVQITLDYELWEKATQHYPNSLSTHINELLRYSLTDGAEDVDYQRRVKELQAERKRKELEFLEAEIKQLSDVCSRKEELEAFDEKVLAGEVSDLRDKLGKSPDIRLEVVVPPRLRELNERLQLRKLSEAEYWSRVVEPARVCKEG